MLIKLAVLGGLGYAGYRYFTGNRDAYRVTERNRAAHENAVAGGPLSNEARVQHTADAPPTGERPQL